MNSQKIIDGHNETWMSITDLISYLLIGEWYLQSSKVPKLSSESSQCDENKL